MHNYIINCLSYLQYRFNKLFDTDKKRVLRTFCNTCAEHFRAVLMSLKTGRAFLSIRSTRICRPLIMSSSSLKQTTIDLLWHAYIITNMKVMVCFYQSFTDFSFKLYDTQYQKTMYRFGELIFLQWLKHLSIFFLISLINYSLLS